MEAINKKRITLKKFESQLMDKFSGNIQKSKHVECDGDGNTSMWLYYRTDVEFGHCATWCSGKGWEFDHMQPDVVPVS